MDSGVRRVMIVDDDIAFLKMVDDLLGGTYAVSLSKSAGHAFRLLDTGYRPDLVLLDVAMPGVDGFETIERLRERRDMETVPIIFLTGASETEQEIRGIQAGAVDYVRKPFKPDVLLARIERHIERGYALQAAGSAAIDEKKLDRIARDLTDTERKIARLIAMGYSNREIAAELTYSYFYVKKVSGIIFDKVGVVTRSELRKLLM